MSDPQALAALIESSRNEVIGLRDNDDVSDPDVVEWLESAATKIERLVDALEEARTERVEARRIAQDQKLHIEALIDRSREADRLREIARGASTNHIYSGGVGGLRAVWNAALREAAAIATEYGDASPDDVDESQSAEYARGHANGRNAVVEAIANDIRAAVLRGEATK